MGDTFVENYEPVRTSFYKRTDFIVGPKIQLMKASFILTWHKSFQPTMPLEA